jgi:hypothetical protein
LPTPLSAGGGSRRGSGVLGDLGDIGVVGGIGVAGDIGAVGAIGSGGFEGKRLNNFLISCLPLDVLVVCPL